MKIRDHNPASSNFLSITLAEQRPDGQPDAGDVRFALRLRFSNGRDQTFLARTDTWVERRALQTFVHELQILEHLRRGSARLVSMSPGELDLVIEPIDHAGHLAVRGQLGGHIYYGPQVPLWNALHFQIDPTQLPHIVRYFRDLGGAGEAR